MRAAPGSSRSITAWRCALAAGRSMSASSALWAWHCAWCASAPPTSPTSTCAIRMASRSAGAAARRTHPRPLVHRKVKRMVKRSDRTLVVGLDIGTSKVVALVGELTGDGAIELIGLGSQPSRGLKKGVVVNIESTVQSIQRAIEEAELMAGCEIHQVYAG